MEHEDRSWTCKNTESPTLVHPMKSAWCDGARICSAVCYYLCTELQWACVMWRGSTNMHVLLQNLPLILKCLHHHHHGGLVQCHNLSINGRVQEGIRHKLIVEWKWLLCLHCVLRLSHGTRGAQTGVSDMCMEMLHVCPRHKGESYDLLHVRATGTHPCLDDGPCTRLLPVGLLVIDDQEDLGAAGDPCPVRRLGQGGGRGSCGLFDSVG